MDRIIWYNTFLRARIAGGFDVNEELPHREYPLYYACRIGSNECAKTLIEAGAHVNSRDFSGWTPLHAACNNNAHEYIETLLKSGADVNAITNIAMASPLHIVCDINDIKAVQLLLEAGADPSAVNADGQLPQDLTTDPGIIELISSYMGGRATKAALK